MSPDEIEAAMIAAFNSCDAASSPLTDRQKQIILQAAKAINSQSGPHALDTANPLDELSQEELTAFLQFVKTQVEQNGSWKAQLLNDWLQENNSGTVQFIRDRYGLQWLNRLETCHFEKYAVDTPKLKVGDRIEVCNALWEWVQENGPCSREWIPCTVIGVEVSNGDDSSTACIIRFSQGAEYEIQGIYEWNSYNWRWPLR